MTSTSSTGISGFTYTALPGRMVFGSGTLARVADEVRCLGCGKALHHKLCHVLDGSFDLPHAETHTVVLPHAAAYNAPAVPEAMARVARALGTAASDASQGLLDLARGLGAPTSLREIGMPASGLDQAAELAVASPYWNPRPIERDAIRALLQAAYDGSPLSQTLSAETEHA